jgi:stage V sporulation protein S
MDEDIRLKVAAGSNPKSVAGSIVNNIRENKGVEIMVMGPQAVNQAMKAIAIARGYIGPEGKEILCRPEFTHLTLDGEEKSAMRLVIVTMDKEI